jgi:hypothetical protein
MKYDEQILLKGAATLEARARQIVVWTAVKYTVIAFGAVAGAGAFIRATTASKDLPAEIMGGIAAAIALVIGIVIGLDRAFELRLRAQQLIALVQIEQNTRKSSLPS